MISLFHHSYHILGHQNIPTYDSGDHFFEYFVCCQDDRNVILCCFPSCIVMSLKKHEIENDQVVGEITERNAIYMLKTGRKYNIRDTQIIRKIDICLERLYVDESMRCMRDHAARLIRDAFRKYMWLKESASNSSLENLTEHDFLHNNKIHVHQ